MRFKFFAAAAFFLVACAKPLTTDPVPGGGPTPSRIGPDTAMSGGTEVGPGGDITQPDAGSAWFVDPTRPVRYCFSVSDDFGYPKAELNAVIEGVFSDWKNYVDTKGIVFPEPELKLALTLQYDTVCDGQEDLRFYFGVEDERVRTHKVYFANPIAFPVRFSNQLGEKGNWGKGFIWISAQHAALPTARFPDWTKPGALAALLRHEIGHTLGLSHVPGTIMAEEIHDLLRTSSPAQLAGIDTFNELYRCVECAARFETTLSALPESSPEDVKEDRAFRLLDKPEYKGLKSVYPLLGREPKGAVRLTLVRRKGETRLGDIHALFVQDDLGKIEMVGSPMDGQVSYFPTGAPLFKIVTQKGTFNLESTDLEYRQAFYRNKDWNLEGIHLTIRYLTHYFRPAERAPVEVLTDKQKNWLVHELFEYVGVHYPLASFRLLNP